MKPETKELLHYWIGRRCEPPVVPTWDPYDEAVSDVLIFLSITPLVIICPPAVWLLILCGIHLYIERKLWSQFRKGVRAKGDEMIKCREAPIAKYWGDDSYISKRIVWRARREIEIIKQEMEWQRTGRPTWKEFAVGGFKRH
ncbi:MAG: hypothetical protein J7L32_05260 [Thermoplasmata archaeon]|nr:hypothetical protein [Thermoplasmata archaeon]